MSSHTSTSSMTMTFSGIAGGIAQAAAMVTEQKIKAEQSRRFKSFLEQMAPGDYPKLDALCPLRVQHRDDFICLECAGTNRIPIPLREVVQRESY